MEQESVNREIPQTEDETTPEESEFAEHYGDLAPQYARARAEAARIMGDDERAEKWAEAGNQQGSHDE